MTSSACSLNTHAPLHLIHYNAISMLLLFHQVLWGFPSAFSVQFDVQFLSPSPLQTSLHSDFYTDSKAKYKTKHNNQYMLITNSVKLIFAIIKFKNRENITLISISCL